MAKLMDLESSEHKGAVALLTKWDVPDNTLGVIAQLHLDVFMFYTVTGLRESRLHTQEKTLRSYMESCRILPPRHVAIMIRPIIPGQNDNLEILTPILEAAQQGQGMIIARGFRDRTWRLTCNEGFMETLGQECERRALRLFCRTACLVAATHGKACKLHGNELDEAGLAVAVALGYKAIPCIHSTTNQRAFLVSAGNEFLSMGDVHFVQILTGIRTDCDNPAPSNQLALLKGPDGVRLDCSSSWFTYANSTPCQVGCFYCETAYRPRLWGEAGCLPVTLAEYLPRVHRGVR